MLPVLNILFTIAHLLIIIFNLTGWIWQKTRKAHLVVLSITIFSWFILGIWYGWGYCPLTDWHWNVKQKLGETNLPNSFIKYVADKISGSDVNRMLIDIVTLSCLITATVCTIYINFIKKKNPEHSQHPKQQSKK